MTTTTDRPASSHSDAGSTVRPAPVSKFAKFVAIFTLVAGAVMVIAGAATWITVQSSPAEERITVSEDSPASPTTPWTVRSPRTRKPR